MHLHSSPRNAGALIDVTNKTGENGNSIDAANNTLQCKASIGWKMSTAGPY